MGREVELYIAVIRGFARSNDGGQARSRAQSQGEARRNKVVVAVVAVVEVEVVVVVQGGGGAEDALETSNWCRQSSPNT